MNCKDPTTLVTQLLSECITLENEIPGSVLDSYGYIQPDVFAKLPNKEKAAFTLFVLQDTKQYRYKFKLVKKIDRPLATGCRYYTATRYQNKKKSSELAVFFMIDEKNGIYFHPKQGMIVEFLLPGFKHEVVDIDTDKIVPLLEEKGRAWMKNFIFATGLI